MLRFADMMLHELLAAGHEVRLVRPEPKVGKFPSPCKFKKWLGYIDKFLLFPRRLRKDAVWADVVHICDHSNAMYVTHLICKPHVITCHDLLAIRSALGEFPENRTGWSGKLLQAWISRGLRSAQSIVCVSYATTHDCERVLQIPKCRLSVVYSGLNYPYSPMPFNEAGAYLSQLGLDHERRYLLCVGNNSWYKNRLFSLRLFEKLIHQYQHDIHMVIVGKKLNTEMNEFIEESKIGDRVTQLGSVSNEDLRALYSCADGLLFPSLQEGFGWPILEAQACGCPVFTSNRVPMTEIGGDAAIYIDPLSPETAAAVINSQFPSLQAMRAKGVVNAANFSNEAMRKAYLEQYVRIIS